MEFYANFGWFGLIGGFVLLGFVLARLDQRLARAFRTGDLRGILLAGLPGIALLQPINNGLEISVSFVAAFVVAHLLAAAAKSFGIVDVPFVHRRGRRLAAEAASPATPFKALMRSRRDITFRNPTCERADRRSRFAELLYSLPDALASTDGDEPSITNNTYSKENKTPFLF